MDGNKLLPIFAALTVALALMAGMKACGKSSRESREANRLNEIPQAPRPDADSPADTIRSLTAQVADMKSQSEFMRKENLALLEQRSQIAQDVSRKVKDEMRAEQRDERDNAYGALASRVEALTARLANQPVAVPELQPNLETPGAEMSWVEPLGRTSLSERAGKAIGAAGQTVRDVAENGGSLLHDGADNAILEHAGLSNQPSPSVPPEPAYTIPRNATLIGSTGMTALIGRVPIKGQVDDPYPFKVLIGLDNLSANGLEVPGVEGMVFSGQALGDWNLSCVRGEIFSVTYVFDDGTIRTLSSDDQSLQQKQQRAAQANGEQANQVSGNKPLGWISDRRGIPCITGERITNAAAYLGGFILARAVEAAGAAYARSQTTVTTSPLTGGFTTGVTGDASKYALGSLATGAGDEIAQWIKERQAQSYDAVFVDTGVELAVHVDRELPIDYEPKGRRLDYARQAQAAGSGGRNLD